jgi:hypothetical protein
MSKISPSTHKLLFALCTALVFSALACTRRTKPQSATSVRASNQALRISPQDSDAAEPAMATGPDGSVYVVWVEHKSGSEADVMLAHFDGAGKRVGLTTRVNSEEGKATAWRGDPPTISVDRDNIIYVGWTARVESPSGHATDIYLSSSRDAGATFTQSVRVNDDDKPAVHGMHSLAVAKNGRIYLAWLDERNISRPQPSQKAEGHHMESNREVFITTSTDGGRTFSLNKQLAVDACPCCKTAVAVGPDNRLYVSWRQVLPGDYRHIAVTSSSDNAQTFSTAVIVSDDHWQIAGCPVSGPALAVSDNGALRVLWYSAGSAGDTGLYWSESLDGARTFAPRREFVKGQIAGTPVLLGMKGNAFTAVWGSSEAPGQVLTARFDEKSDLASCTIDSDSGELPAGSRVGDRPSVAYVSRANKLRSIWLIKG